MSNLSQITAAAMALSVEDRARLAQELWASLAPVDTQELSLEMAEDADLFAEFERRDKEMDAPGYQAMTHEEVMELVKKSLSCE